MLSFQIMSCLLPAPKCVHVWLCLCAGRHMQIHVNACLESPPYCACRIFLWKSPLRLLFSLSINCRAEKLHQSCFLLACPPVETEYEVCWSVNRKLLGWRHSRGIACFKTPRPSWPSWLLPRQELGVWCSAARGWAGCVLRVGMACAGSASLADRGGVRCTQALVSVGTTDTCEILCKMWLYLLTAWSFD